MQVQGRAEQAGNNVKVTTGGISPPRQMKHFFGKQDIAWISKTYEQYEENTETTMKYGIERLIPQVRGLVSSNNINSMVRGCYIGKTKIAFDEGGSEGWFEENCGFGQYSEIRQAKIRL